MTLSSINDHNTKHDDPDCSICHPSCWFCDKPVGSGYFCTEFDCDYHEECGNKVSTNLCAVCVSEGCQHGNHDGFEPCRSKEQDEDWRSGDPICIDGRKILDD